MGLSLACILSCFLFVSDGLASGGSVAGGILNSLCSFSVDGGLCFGSHVFLRRGACGEL